MAQISQKVKRRLNHFHKDFANQNFFLLMLRPGMKIFRVRFISKTTNFGEKTLILRLMFS